MLLALVNITTHLRDEDLWCWVTGPAFIQWHSQTILAGDSAQRSCLADLLSSSPLPRVQLRLQIVNKKRVQRVIDAVTPAFTVWIIKRFLRYSTFVGYGYLFQSKWWFRWLEINQLLIFISIQMRLFGVRDFFKLTPKYEWWYDFIV